VKKLLLISSAIIISLLLSVVLACTFFIIPISNTLANWQLQRLYPDSNIHVSTLNFNQLTLDEFYIQSPTLNINIKNANITYTPTQLWEGQVSDIVIDVIRTKISIKEDKQESIEKNEGSNSFEFPLHPLDLIPLSSLVIKKATLIIEDQGQIEASISLNKRKAEDINNLKGNQL
jgi:hypothetical protein